MKVLKIISVLVVAFTSAMSIMASTISVKSDAVSWLTIEEAQVLTKENPKPIFIDFTAKWCGWCKEMDSKTFANPQIAAYVNENFYAVKVDFDSKEKFEYLGEKYTGKELARKYRITGLPTIIFASPDFSKIKPVVGYQNVKQFMNKLEKFKEL